MRIDIGKGRDNIIVISRGYVENTDKDVAQIPVETELASPDDVVCEDHPLRQQFLDYFDV